MSTSDEHLAILFIVAFPFAFIALGWLVLKLLHLLSGWEWLENKYPDRVDNALWRISRVSGVMGNAPPFGTSLSRTLTLEVCDAGIRVRNGFPFSLLWHPFFVPYEEIEIRSHHILFRYYVKMIFGRPEVGNLALRPSAAAKLARASQGKLDLPCA
ncbi:hypothetical protein [Aurantiacibacter luteus]|uniref:Uncharacterized protein n=1 Tax=Aurantiacibacter luteus TaxID=1581420 RepID=A0A0G9MY83_9SPHN|nr:hypothetical protein [Aurantiacibacter luteus]KLE35737.1 hypothetical protein AAW00_04945 [Aurantiacibacter luteus]